MEHWSLMLLTPEYANVEIPKQDNAVWYWHLADVPLAELILLAEACPLLTESQNQLFNTE